MSFRKLCVPALFLIALAGCTGESVRVVLPESHPANPSATEAPFEPFPDPFAGVSLPAPPSRLEKPPLHRHEHHPGQMDEQMRMDDMNMDNMNMDDKKSDEMMHGGHTGTGAGKRKEQ